MFQEVTAHHAAANREIRSFNMDRDGFALLVMSWTGPAAFIFKLAHARAAKLIDATFP